MSAVIKLSKPVMAHGEQIDVIELREPTSDDAIELGYPYLVHSGDAGAAFELRPKVLANYLVRLGKVPLSTVKAMSIADLQACQAVVLGFFGHSEDEAETPTSS